MMGEIESKLEDVTEELELKIQGNDGKNGDGSGIFRYKEAQKQVKKEIRDMNVSIGLLSSNLHQLRCREANLLEAKRRQKQRNKKAGSRGKRDDVGLDFNDYDSS